MGTLTAIADRDDRVVLLTGDLGFMVIEEFADRHPTRFINVGVAEANMLGVAAGMASDGRIPFCYSIATFATMRGYEQLRDGAVLHRLPVRVVGVGPGFAYGSAGPTHHALEDLAITRVQPGMTVIGPADDHHVAQALEATYALPGPIYYRLGKNAASLPDLPPFALGRVAELRRGDDVSLLTTGTMAEVGLRTAAILAENGVDAGVHVVETLAPTPAAPLVELLRRAPAVVTIEDHYVTGGLGSLVAEVLADSGLHTRLVRCGVTEGSDGTSGSDGFLLARAGLSPETLAERARLAVTGADQRLLA